MQKLSPTKQGYSSGHLSASSGMSQRGTGPLLPQIASAAGPYAVKGKDEATASVKLIKTCVLVVLCFQNSGHALLTRYSSSILHESYSSTEVVIVGEFIKLFFSGVLTIVELNEPMSGRLARLQTLIIHSYRVFILAGLYMAGNILAYYALARVEAATYTVFLQLKVLTTAMFSRIILGKRFTWTQWRALILLIVGCILVASPTIDPAEVARRVLADENGSYSAVAMGIGSVLVMVSISGFASVYFEGILKDEKERCTIWERNFQLSFFSIFLLLLYNTFEHQNEPPAELNENWLFKGWTMNTVLICVIQASGGLLVAATLKYADSVVKTLVTAGSIVLSTVFGHFLLGGALDMYVALGCSVTIIAIFNYMFVDYGP